MFGVIKKTFSFASDSLLKRALGGDMIGKASGPRSPDLKR